MRDTKPIIIYERRICLASYLEGCLTKELWFVSEDKLECCPIAIRFFFFTDTSDLISDTSDSNPELGHHIRNHRPTFTLEPPQLSLELMFLILQILNSRLSAS